MIVQELIDELNKIKDKNLEVYFDGTSFYSNDLREVVTVESKYIYLDGKSKLPNKGKYYNNNNKRIRGVVINYAKYEKY